VTTPTFEETARTTPTRNRQRVSYDRDAVHEVLDEGILCHVGLIVDGQPLVLPQLYVRVGDCLYLHGSSGARALRLADRAELAVCVTVTLVDGVVLARSAFHHSMNYRSVVAHGLAEVVRDPEEKTTALAALVDAVVAGRSDHTRGPSARELAATTVLRLPLTEVSLKARSGPPGDDAEDLDLPYWAGVLPLTTSVGEPVPAADLADAAVPPHVARWRPGPNQPEPGERPSSRTQDVE
jgi:nitroimidazol reductase NimA-like FMN-containing flavoprotein (pyridoxamine 5'-phosphate oxidase superfamily)